MDDKTKEILDKYLKEINEDATLSEEKKEIIKTRLNANNFIHDYFKENNITPIETISIIGGMLSQIIIGSKYRFSATSYLFRTLAEYFDYFEVLLNVPNDNESKED